jgi:hypothetical protein
LGGWVRMQSRSNESQSDADETWTQIAPLLDTAIADLSEKDRHAIVLRFFENQSLSEIGKALGANEDSARMRVNRAVEKLRQFFATHGVISTTTIIAGLISSNSVKAAPAAMASSITTAVMSGAAVSTLPFVQALALMARLKAKFLIAAGVGTVALYVAGLHYYNSHSQSGNNSVSNTVATVPLVPDHETEGALAANNGNARPVIASTENDLAELIANLRAALNSAASTMVPGPEVVAAIQRFGSRGNIAFSVLKGEALANEDVEKFSTEDRARNRAVSGMGFVGKTVPEAIPFLWNLYDSIEDKSADGRAYHSLVALYQIGLAAQDIPKLSEKVLAFTNFHASDRIFKSQAADWIATLIRKDSVAAQPFIPDVEKLLTHPDRLARFWAACALAEYEGAHYPGIFDEIAAGLESADQETRGHAHEGAGNQNGILGSASHLFGRIGAAMRPIVPALLEAAKASKDENARNAAFLAAGRISPELRKEVPEIHEALTKNEREEAWVRKINSGRANFFELQQDLKNPERAGAAAILLGQMGPVAADAVPDVIRALLAAKGSYEGKQIYEALRKIDPEAALPYAPIDMGTLQWATERIQAGKTPDEREQISAVVQDMVGNRNTGPWPSRAILAEFAKRLAAVDREASKAFVAAVLEKDPEMKDVFISLPQ